MFGLGEAEVATLVRAVVAEEVGSSGEPGGDGGPPSVGPNREGIREAFARATWTGLAEPGDGVAGAVTRAIGPAAALDAVVEHRSAAELSIELRAAGEDLGLDDIAAALARWQPRLVSATALLALRQAARFGARLLTPGRAGWPSGVDDLGDHGPIALWCRGTDAALAALPASIALVGARAATGYGEHVTMEASAGLVDRGYAIVSGAAFGIDGMAHRAALASGGATVAFLAGGVDRFYPSAHDALLGRIVEVGAVISELPCGAPPTKWRFLQRNRLIAASTLATVVLEAGWRSGSLNTAGHAAQLGRPLGAVPGPVTSAASAGCHRLIRDYAAVCVTNADEMAELAPLTGVRAADPSPAVDRTTRASGIEASRHARPAPAPRERTADETRVLDAVSTRSPRTSTDIAARAGMSVAAVQAILGALELEEVTQESDRGWTRAAARPAAS